MDLHPYMVEAIYLRQHPQDRIVKDTGVILWFDTNTNKYMWSNPSSKTRTKSYEAKGLNNWWKQYLKIIENYDFEEEEDLPY